MKAEATAAASVEQRRILMTYPIESFVSGAWAALIRVFSRRWIAADCPCCPMHTHVLLLTFFRTPLGLERRLEKEAGD